VTPPVAGIRNGRSVASFLPVFTFSLGGFFAAFFLAFLVIVFSASSNCSRHSVAIAPAWVPGVLRVAWSRGEWGLIGRGVRLLDSAAVVHCFTFFAVVFVWGLGWPPSRRPNVLFLCLGPEGLLGCLRLIVDHAPLDSFLISAFVIRPRFVNGRTCGLASSATWCQ
jgi:hypothetical protein